MIYAVKDIQYHIKFRKDNPGRARVLRRRSASGYDSHRSGSDSLQVSEEVTLLSRMGLSWGESDVTVDEYGFRFVLVFRKKNREATVTCLKQHENTIADVSIWLQGDTGFRRNYQQELGQSSEMYPCRSDLSRDVLHDLELFENEMNPQVLDSLLAVAFVYWKVSLSRCQKAAMRAAEFPFLLHKSSEEI